MSTATASTGGPQLTEFYGGTLDGHVAYIEPADELRDVRDGHLYRLQPVLSRERKRRVMISQHLTKDRRHA